MTFCILKSGRKVMKATCWDRLISHRSIIDPGGGGPRESRLYEVLIDAVVPVGVEWADAKLESSEPVK
jgi:hypothetical protein